MKFRKYVVTFFYRTFIQSHPDIRFIGLIMTPASHADEFFEQDHQDYISTLKVKMMTLGGCYMCTLLVPDNWVYEA